MRAGGDLGYYGHFGRNSVDSYYEAMHDGWNFFVNSRTPGCGGPAGGLSQRC